MTEESLLKRLYIAAPCDAKWEEMSGDERVRMCDLCTKHVYNISDMSKREAEAFLRKKGTSECARFYRRRDGTIITDDCPVGVRKVRNAIRTIWMSTASGMGVALAMVVTAYKLGDITLAAKNETDKANLAIDIAACQRSKERAVGNVDPRCGESGQMDVGSSWTSRANYFKRFPVGGEAYFADDGSAFQQAYEVEPGPEQSLIQRLFRPGSKNWLSDLFYRIWPHL